MECLEGPWIQSEQRPTPSATPTLLSLVGALTAVVGVVTGVVLSRDVDPALKVGAVVTTLLLLTMLVLTASGWSGRIYRKLEKSRYENQLVNHTEVLAELAGFVDEAERLWGNIGFEGFLTKLHESIVQDMQTGNLLKSPTMSPSVFYVWIYYIKGRTSRAVSSPDRLTTSEFSELAKELGTFMTMGGDYVRYYLQNLVSDPSYSPSKITRDVYDAHKGLNNSLAESFQRYVKKVNTTLGSDISASTNILHNLK